ncbi:hypothetical protein [Bacteroides sp. UBA939]|uniref:hypothetical protein n=1 Tax=Bacteroides sp. UBA939 TaxID=1946092 RepID=UPI0025B93AF6|nr:hypothetical protein [Bacteroides sp. UBA939]
MKKIIYTGLTFLFGIALASCEKNDIDYDAIPASEMAQIQITHFTPVERKPAFNIYKVELNGKLLSNDKSVLSYYNTNPGPHSSYIARFYTTKPGKANLKFYQSTELNEVYNQDVTLKKGKQNVIVYDYSKPPIVLDRDYDISYPLDPAKASYDTDTISFVRFINLMFENDTQPTTMKFQYQYKYTLHPLYTIADEKAGRIPEGKKVGDATRDATKSEWLNLGIPVAFGESTGFLPVPAIKTTYVSQGAARVDFRIVVSAENGGVPGETVVDDVDYQLRVINSSSKFVAYTDYWSQTTGRYQTHYFGGTRTQPTKTASVVIGYDN